jgi:SAM-dependent methyltransferase
MGIRDWFGYRKQRHSSVEAWQKQNPSRPLREFYAERAERKMRRGKPHRTLGANMRNRDFGISGKTFFEKLVEFSGLKPGDACVDYGCGTLRIGIHLIEYLDPGRYWGFDVSDFLLDQGRELIGERLIEEKRPNLRIISPAAIEEAAAAKPKLLFSNRVLNHVQPEELSEYFSNLLKMIGSSGQAVVTGKWSTGETVPIRSGKSWAYSVPTLQECIEAEGGSMRILVDESSGPGIRAGAFRIVAKKS